MIKDEYQEAIEEMEIKPEADYSSEPGHDMVITEHMIEVEQITSLAKAREKNIISRCIKNL